ncbi:MAG: hypothetical protein M3N07_07095 [Pseudomonadota bacterium]|nr:hypothetical protein [Pseudomonadota bacterium]
MSQEDPRRDEEIRARQRGRAVVMAITLAAFVVLMYLITIARMSAQ